MFFLLSSVNYDDLWSAMQSALDLYNLKNIHIKEIMNPWTQLKHYPVLKVTQFEFKLEICLENYDRSNQETLYIPVTYYTYYFRVIRTHLRLSWLIAYNIYQRKLTINHSANFSVDWIIINIDEAGKNIHCKRFIIIIFIFYKYFLFKFIYILNIFIYSYLLINILFIIGYYRTNYDVKNWQQIAKYLKYENFTKIPVVNRAQLIDDAFHFLMKEQLNLSLFLELSEYLQRETDYIAWFPVFKALEYMSSFFQFQGSIYIKVYTG